METNEKEQIKKVAEVSTEGVKEESVEQMAEKQEEVKVVLYDGWYSENYLPMPKGLFRRVGRYTGSGT